MDDRFLDITKQYINSIIDEMIMRGTESKELYDKQSDFAKIMFFATISCSKEQLVDLFQKANETEKEYLKMNTEVN